MRKILIVIFILLCCTTTKSFGDVERFTIQSNLDSSYLPYRFQTIRTDSLYSLSYPTDHLSRILKTANSLTDSTHFIKLNNPTVMFGTNSWFSKLSYPSATNNDDDQVRSIVADWMIYPDTILSDNFIVGVGLYNNSIELFRSQIHKESPPQYLTLLSIKTGKKLTGSSAVCLVEDYDYDGNLEVFIYLNYNHIARTLFCIDLNDWKIEWQLEVSSPIQTKILYSCENRENPSIIFATINPGNGKEDKNYTDGYSYISVVNQFGEIISNKISGYYSFHTPLLCSDTLNNIFYVTHIANTIEIGDDNSISPQRKISKLNSSGTTLFTTSAPEKISAIKTAEFGPTNAMSLFVNHNYEFYEIYDTNLSLIAISDSLSIQTNLIGVINIRSEENPVYVFYDGLYNYDFEQILQFPFRCSSYEIARIDSLGNTIDLLISTRNKSYLGRITKKTILELVSVFYHKNQLYLLMLLSGLFVGLVIVSIYQKRTKQNLNLIVSQKSELETTHQKLEETQLQLIEAEKYKQAKDIAGGFAHEIRNALFPVDGSLNKLFRMNNQNQYDKIKFDNYSEKIKSSTNRAIDMTELISQYTKIDSEYLPEQVNISKVINEVIESNLSRLKEQNVTLKSETDTNIVIESNYQQLYIVFNNLLLNSLDALTNRDNCHILIKVWADHQDVHLTFTDNGIGISSENISKIFNTFFSTKPTKGTGIGLSMVKKIIEMYNGTIKVSSEENCNTIFELAFKRSKK